MSETTTEETRTATELEVADLSVAFGGVRAISGVTTRIDQRELVAVVGPNGAGKSTLLNAISGLVRRQTTGAISLRGEPIQSLTATRRAVLGIGRSFQSPPLVESMTVTENVMAGAFGLRDYTVLDQLVRWRKVARSEREREDQARSILEFMGLDGVADVPADEIAYAQRKLVDIARALMAEPSLLLLDEPTSGLGRSEHAAMGELLTRLMARRSITIVMVEHHMDLVRETATRVLGLQAGRVVADGPTAQVLDSEEFRATLVGAQPDSAEPGGVGPGTTQATAQMVEAE
jgi:branched-chain amino acid transport system ATP-binding protein